MELAPRESWFDPEEEGTSPSDSEEEMEASSNSEEEVETNESTITVPPAEIMVVMNNPWFLPNRFDSIDAGMAALFVDVKFRKVHNTLIEHLMCRDDLLPADELILIKVLLKVGGRCVKLCRYQGLNENGSSMEYSMLEFSVQNILFLLSLPLFRSADANEAYLLE